MMMRSLQEVNVFFVSPQAHILAIYSEAARVGFSAESGFCAMIR